MAVGLALLAQPGWRKETTEKGEVAEVKPIPSTGVVATCAALSFLCLMLQIAAATWQQVVAAGERDATGYAFQGDVSITTGRTAAAFVWLSTGIFFLTSLMGKWQLASLLYVRYLVN